MISVLLFCSLAFCENKVLALQIALDRAGYSCNAIDGKWGMKSSRALERYLSTRAGHDKNERVPQTPEAAYDRYLAGDTNLFCIATVTQKDLDSLVKIPSSAGEKAKLPRMGYESIREMFAERGHLSPRALESINPGIDWNSVSAGTRLVIPNFPTIEEDLKRTGYSNKCRANQIVVDLGHFEITAYDRDNKLIALFPCSIAKSKSKLPPAGKMKIINAIARPNYTYTPDHTPAGEKPRRHVWPEGENCPIGVAWLGLNLPGYGIHGTPKPETIGHAESHGCFRLANWNAARLFALCSPGTSVIIIP